MQTAPPPSAGEDYCAWYGDAREGVLYFGEAAFWSALRATGDPTGDLRVAGPQRIGRFDLASERMAEALDVGRASGPEPRSGVWDVLAHPDGRVFFTTYFDRSGWVEPGTGRVTILPALGPGLNELALGPEGSVLATRYGGPGHPDGSLVWIARDGALLAEHPLAGPAAYRVAPKSVAFDPSRGAVWLTTDLVSESGGPVRQDGRVIELATGREIARWDDPELQFVVFDDRGAGYLVERDGSRLVLRVVRPEDAGPLEAVGRRVLLDGAFTAGLDFAQDARVGADGRIVVTRWSGRIDVVDLGAAADAAVRPVDLPRPKDGLYYTAVLEGGRVCATLCAGVTVVCAAAP